MTRGVKVIMTVQRMLWFAFYGEILLVDVRDRNSSRYCTQISNYKDNVEDNVTSGIKS